MFECFECGAILTEGEVHTLTEDDIYAHREAGGFSGPPSDQAMAEVGKLVSTCCGTRVEECDEDDTYD